MKKRIGKYEWYMIEVFIVYVIIGFLIGTYKPPYYVWCIYILTIVYFIVLTLLSAKCEE